MCVSFGGRRRALTVCLASGGEAKALVLVLALVLMVLLALVLLVRVLLALIVRLDLGLTPPTSLLIYYKTNPTSLIASPILSTLLDTFLNF